MPAGKPRRKDDTWTTDELNRALKGPKDDSDRRRRDRDDRDRRHRDDDDRRRRHKDDINGDDRRRQHKDRDASEDKRRHRKDSPDRQIELTEDERERQRRERRERREKKEPSKPEKREKKRDAVIEDEDDRRHHRDRDDDRHKNRDDDRERRHKDDDRRHRRDEDDRRKRDDDKRRHRDDGDRRRRDDDDRRKHRDDDRRRHKDDDSGSRRRRDDDNKSRNKDEADRDRRRRDRHNEDDGSFSQREESPELRVLTEDDRERQRQERREKREKKDKKDRDDEKKDGGKEERRQRDRNDDTKGKEEKKSALRNKKFKTKITSKKSSSSRRKEPEPEEDEDDYNYDDDDFEDYDDDFEDDDDGDDDDDDKPKQEEEEPNGIKSEKELLDIHTLNEMDALMKAMNEENSRLTNGSQRSLRSDETDESEERYKPPPPKANRGRTFIDFVSAKQVALSSKTASRTKKRGEDLLQLIELDKARYDMFDLPPVREYEMYIRSFGRSNTKQAYVQTNEDNIDRDLQTEEIETKEKWTQLPSDDILCVGGDGIDPESAQDTGLVSRQVDSVKLAKFVDKAGQMLGMLLEEEREGGDRRSQSSTKSNVGFSDGFTELGRPKFIGDRHVTHACFCPNQSNMLLTVYSSTHQSTGNPVDNHGLICVWNVNDLTYPYRILGCEAEASSCCFSPTRASLAFCGTHDGSVVVWDLRETGSMHRSVTAGEEEVTVRFPTYSTARVLEGDNHHSPVTTIVPVYSTLISSKTDEAGDTSTGLSFQLATVEQNGVVNLWVVTEIATPDLAGSEMDLGLAPGGRVKLLKSSTIVLHSPVKSLRNKGDVQTFEMQLMPADLNHFYVGTDTGSVVHGVRFGSRGFPHAYTPSIESPVNVVTIDFSPFGSPYLLAGCDDGALYLYHSKSESPLISWPVFCAGCGVRCVRWSRSRPTVFYVLDESSTVHVMDLLESDSMPIQRDQINGGRVMTMCLANDSKLSGGGPARPPQLLLSLDTGRTEVHSISKKLSQMQTLEQDFMEKYVDKY